MANDPAAGITPSFGLRHASRTFDTRYTPYDRIEGIAVDAAGSDINQYGTGSDCR